MPRVALFTPNRTRCCYRTKARNFVASNASPAQRSPKVSPFVSMENLRPSLLSRQHMGSGVRNGRVSAHEHCESSCRGAPDCLRTGGVSAYNPLNQLTEVTAVEKKPCRAQMLSRQITLDQILVPFDPGTRPVGNQSVAFLDDQWLFQNGAGPVHVLEPMTGRGRRQ